MTTLLYVDDEETIGRAVARMFGLRGDVALIAKSVAEAQDILEHNQPDIVFIDVWLGDESGFEILAWIEDFRPDLAQRVTFVTGELVAYDDPDSVWAKLGRPVIQKPFDFKHLIDAVDHAGRGAGT